MALNNSINLPVNESNGKKKLLIFNFFDTFLERNNGKMISTRNTNNLIKNKGRPVKSDNTTTPST
jgi:hypothetical protein